MTDATSNESITDLIGADLPYLRRYARALTGSQETGDHYAAATLEAILSDPGCIGAAETAKADLFRVFHGIWVSSGAPVEAGTGGTGMQERAQEHLARLTPNTREAMLLHSIERMTDAQIARIMDIAEADVGPLLDIARREMADNVKGRVLVIEDEAIIAMDISAIVSNIGHKVTGVARTRARAIDLARSDPPDLILSDIQLADNSSGIDAAREILTELGDRPVVFITAFPERLLTGRGREPAFLITKPYTEDQVVSAVGQAMFFASTDSLMAGR
ncbi:response regulator [Maritimibacter sp. 55A14]|uniref:response regulator n=1 Tax=Maritimibacter sp. 55A14 TaxID=2174844 RepID=UPI000D60FD13|nr:response regulator [Maritimibacter sp. 55A14]PWE33490.1 response regulator [Maritimibacter sp. 55A14]